MSTFFIEDENDFEFNIYCEPIIYGSKTVGIKIINDNQNSADTITVSASPRTFEKLSQVLEDTTIINHVTGKPMIKLKDFRYGIAITFFKSWNLYYDENTMIPITLENLKKIQYPLLKELVSKYLNITGGKI